MTTIEQPTQIRVEDAESVATKPLTSLDRCDSCGAQAYVRAMLGDSELLFCGHHAKAHEQKLKTLADAWHDETHKLNA